MNQGLKVSLLTAGMIFGAGSAFAGDGKSIIGAIDNYSSISQEEMAATKGTRFASAYADASAAARGRYFSTTSTYTNAKVCTISCGGGGVSATSTSSSYAAAR